MKESSRLNGSGDVAETVLHIKNLCCGNCIEAVRAIFQELGYVTISVSLGEVRLKNALTSAGIERLNQRLLAKGFAIVKSATETTVIKIKAALFNYLDLLRNEDGNPKLSAYIEQQVGQTYGHLSRLFSGAEGIPIEQFLLLLRMEKAKEWLLQDEMTIADIASFLGYGCSQTFTTQFRKATGKTPNAYRREPTPGRVHLNRLGNQDF